MEIHPHVAAVVGNTTHTKWGQVLQTPFAYGVIEVHTEKENARDPGVKALSQIVRLLDKPIDGLPALRHIAASVMHERVVSLILLVPVRDVLYIVSRGTCRVYMRRNTKLAKLVNNDQSLSGAVQPGDTIIAASSGFVHALSDEDIGSVFDDGNPQEVAERLTLVLHEKLVGVGGAALIFHVNNHQVQKVVKPHMKMPALPRFSFSFLKKIHMPRRMEKKHIIPILLVSLFFISVGLGIKKQQDGKKGSEISRVLVEAQHAYEEGVALADLNPVKGRERLDMAKDVLMPFVVDNPRSEEARQVKMLYEEITQQYTRALHIVRATPEVFFDVSLLKTGASISDASFFGNEFVFLDSKGKTVYRLKVDTKAGAIIAGGDAFTDSSEVAFGGGNVYVLTQKGIHEINATNQKTTNAKIPFDPEWASIADMSVFGGNMYLADKGKSRIWKYTATDSGFSERREYLNPDYFPDLSGMSNMVIDGSVWVGTNNGKILRFSQGTENSYTPQGAEPELGKNLVVFAGDEVKMIYILDADHNRVAVFDKDGLYISQYAWEPGFSPGQLFVSESFAKIFLLAEGKLYSIDLQ